MFQQFVTFKLIVFQECLATELEADVKQLKSTTGIIFDSCEKCECVMIIVGSLAGRLSSVVQKL